ncbi:MAG: hypothetical protein IT343_19790 [Candidatus Melainabacteria bacterium]|nr:hypothetical protein [Candidatus Melainabacteria bacterium]
MAKKNIQLTAAAHNNDTVVLLAVDWPAGVKIEGCLGFAITRIAKDGKRSVIETKLPFEGQDDNSDWKSQPSTVWPIQRKWHLDFSGKKGETYTYEIQAMGGEPGNLKPMKGLVATTEAVTLTTKVDETFDCGFTRGILSTQWLARYIGTLPDGTPDFQKIIDALEDYDNPNNVIRKHLMANAPEMLMAPIKECVEDGGKVYAALYELSANQLVDFLLKHLKYFSLILGNTGQDDFTNAPARKALHEAGADIQDRMIGPWGIAHNKSQVKVDKDENPTDVTTGSTNWTNTGLGCQSNMVTRIRNAQVAANFLDYWKRMKADGSEQSLEFRRRNAKGYDPVVLPDGTIIETYFQPSMDDKVKGKGLDVPLSPWLIRVKELMEGAKDVLCGEVFYPGSPSVIHWMAEIWDNRPDLYAFMTVSSFDALRGVKAKRRKGRPPVFTLATGREEQFANFITELLKLPEAHAITHGKIIVIDPFGEKPVVIFGSDNLGAKASYGNDENGVIVIGNKALAQYVFVNMFDINKHFQSRAAARASKYRKQTVGWTGKLAASDAWQDNWIDGYKAKEARLLATGVWDGSGLVDHPNNRSVYVIPLPKKKFPPKPAGIIDGAAADGTPAATPATNTVEGEVAPIADNPQPGPAGSGEQQ